MIDAETLIGKWALPEVRPGWLPGLDRYVHLVLGQFVISFVLKRAQNHG
jgi:hypothetical protein